MKYVLVFKIVFNCVKVNLYSALDLGFESIVKLEGSLTGQAPLHRRHAFESIVKLEGSLTDIIPRPLF